MFLSDDVPFSCRPLFAVGTSRMYFFDVLATIYLLLSSGQLGWHRTVPRLFFYYSCRLQLPDFFSPSSMMRTTMLQAQPAEPSHTLAVDRPFALFNLVAAAAADPVYLPSQLKASLAAAREGICVRQPRMYSAQAAYA